MSEKPLLNEKNKKMLILLVSIIGIITLTIFIVPDFRSVIFPDLATPDEPINGVGYAIINLQDPLSDDIIVNAKFDLIKVNNTDEYYARGINTGTTIHLTESCYISFNGTVVGTYPRNYYSFSGTVEASDDEDAPQNNTFTLVRKANADEIGLTIFKRNGVYGNFLSSDISNKVNLNLSISITNSNSSNRIAINTWMANLTLNQTSVDLGVTGQSLWLGFVGTTEAPINCDTCLVDDYNRTVVNIGKMSVLKLTIEHEAEYTQTLYIPEILDVSSVILYNEEITDWYCNQLEVIS
jgi:hypothetical protein